MRQRIRFATLQTKRICLTGLRQMTQRSLMQSQKQLALEYLIKRQLQLQSVDSLLQQENVKLQKLQSLQQRLKLLQQRHQLLSTQDQKIVDTTQITQFLILQERLWVMAHVFVHPVTDALEQLLQFRILTPAQASAFLMFAYVLTMDQLQFALHLRYEQQEMRNKQLLMKLSDRRLHHLQSLMYRLVLMRRQQTQAQLRQKEIFKASRILEILQIV